uniref:Uncharacterized protein n=1 Tax=Pithovirus LCPAC406 TaxID=2506599 RepID=A0A481ZD27_9VIRU|nr:MAG: hypothetical protein LCPAC406_01670 [Pithovirus LCPAC406]
MYVYVVISENLKFETSVDVYYSYDNAFVKAKELMLLEIDRVYKKASLDELGVKFRDYPRLLYDDGSISVEFLTIVINKKEVQ